MVPHGIGEQSSSYVKSHVVVGKGLVPHGIGIGKSSSYVKSM
ncbi:hypothetical protein QUF72_01600 [Desulfobacterales bacterium HSG2]|nr:hypothetical protein [Desulfobacterales bacterium HSG2]